MNKKLNMKISTFIAGIMLVSVLAMVVPMVSALPQGATDTVQSNNVTFGTYNLTGGSYTSTGFALGEGTATLWTHVVTYDLKTSDGLLGLTVTYIKEDGSTGTVDVNYTINQSVSYWMSDTVVNLVNVTSIAKTSGGTVISGNIEFVATVNREGLYQAVGGTDIAKGGFITETNFDTEQRTAKWQGYYGNITGRIVLEDSQKHEMYNWTWNSSKGGEVIATTNTSIPYWTGVTNVTTTERDETSNGINAKWGWETDQSDDADATFSNDTYDLVVAGTSLTNTIATADDSILPTGKGWKTAVIKDSSSIDSKEDYLFVGIIKNDAEAFDTTTKDFQMIVPVGDTPTSTDTYYFYVELT